MEAKVNLKNIYAPSEDIVARDLAGEFIIIPIASGIGDTDEEIFSLNEFGKAIWDKLDGKRSLKEVVKDLRLKFEDSDSAMEKDVVGLIDALVKRNIVREIK